MWFTNIDTYCDMTSGRRKCAEIKTQQRHPLLNNGKLNMFPIVMNSTRIYVRCWAAVLVATILQACRDNLGVNTVLDFYTILLKL